MRIVHLLTLGVSCALVACSGSGGGSKAIYHPDVGPFDENGDYVIALADAPVRKNNFSRSRSKAKRSSKPKQIKRAEPEKVQRLAKVTAPSPAPRPAAAPTRSAAPRTVVIAQSPASRPATRPVAPPRPVPQAVRQPTPQPAPQPAAAPKPAPKPVVMKPKKKAPLRHVVTKSDTLFGLSRKYGVSVGSIQRANRLKGTTIITGKTLLIPR